MHSRQIGAECLASFLELFPIAQVGQRRDGDQFALVQTCEGSIDHLLSRHDDLCGKIMDGQLGAVPKLSAGGPGQNSLHLDTLVLDLVMEGLREIDHECFGAAVDAVEQFGAEGDDGSDVDDEPFGALQETRQGRGM